MMKVFDPTPYARLRSFGDGQERDMRMEPLRKTRRGYTLAPADAGEWQLGFMWDEPRQFTGVEVRLDKESPKPLRWRVEYWRCAWPRQPESHRPGAAAGWLAMDDQFHGVWREALGEHEQHGDCLSMAFDPLDIVEFEDKDDEKYAERFFQSDELSAPYRQALRLRLVFEGAECPRVKAVRWLGTAVPVKGACRIVPHATGGKGPDGGSVSLWNGDVKGESRFGENTDGLIQYTYNTNVGCSGDRTILQLALPAPWQSLGVAAEDVERGVYLPDYDLLLYPAHWTEEAAAIVRRLTEGKQSVYDRVEKHPEQTLQGAFDAIPEMKTSMQPPYGRYVLMGWQGVRQKMCLRYNGDIFADKINQKVCKRDCAKIRWAGGSLHFRMGSGDPVSFGEGEGERKQHMPDAAVPVYVTQWLDRRVEYTQTAFAAPMERIDGYARGDEDMIVLSRVQLRNASSGPRRAVLAINLHPQEALRYEHGRLLAEGRVRVEDSVALGWRQRNYPKPRLRAIVTDNAQGTWRCVPIGAAGVTTGQLYNKDFHDFYDGYHNHCEATGTIPNTLVYEVELAAGESAVVDMKIPYPTYDRESDFRRVEGYDFDQQRCMVEACWRAFADRAAKVSVPVDRRLNDFVRAVPWHVTMTASRDVDTGFYVVPAGTYLYGACGNEACMQIDMLDMLGYHEIAERYLESFIDSQGAGNMDGNFTSREGALVVNDYNDPKGKPELFFAYNLDHGYILQCLARHYRITGNQEWLRHAAPTMTAGCAFVKRERAATKVLDDQGEKVSYWGLLPHGRLEDNAEWRCWAAVNAHACAGMLDCAHALSEINHPEAAQWEAEALAYREDILNAMRRAIALASAVPDGKGGYMPHVPSQVESRSREHGWFRQAAYGPLHLAEHGVLPADDPLITWVLRDLEDNLLLSREWGRNIDREKHWFGQGGIAIQSNLLFNDRVYLERDQAEYAVRVLYNNFAQNLYRDMNCFTEHPIPEFGVGYGPFFKTSDESQFIVNLRRHLVREEGNTLHLLQGAAREWLLPGKEISFADMPTEFGRVSLRLNMAEDGHSADMTLRGDWRRKPEIALRLRHGLQYGMTFAALNGVPVNIQGETLRFTPEDGDMTLRIAWQ